MIEHGQIHSQSASVCVYIELSHVDVCVVTHCRLDYIEKEMAKKTEAKKKEEDEPSTYAHFMQPTHVLFTIHHTPVQIRGKDQGSLHVARETELQRADKN